MSWERALRVGAVAAVVASLAGAAWLLLAGSLPWAVVLAALAVHALVSLLALLAPSPPAREPPRRDDAPVVVGPAATNDAPDGRPVVDGAGRGIGVLEGLARSGRTRSPVALVVRLFPDARRALGLADDRVEIPLRFVHAMRRDGIVLDRGLASVAVAAPAR